MVFSSLQHVGMMHKEIRRFKVIYTPILSYLKVYKNLTHIRIEREGEREL